MPPTDLRAPHTDPEPTRPGKRRGDGGRPVVVPRGRVGTPREPAAATSDDYVPFANVEARNGLQARIEVPLLLRALRLPRGGRVLEIGCGRGVALPVLARGLDPAALVGVDVDATLLAAAERRVRADGAAAHLVELVEADVRALPLDAASFDLVIDFGTCYHVSGGAAGSRAALGEVARVLRPGGLFVHETRVAQLLAHPVRSVGRALPWDAVPHLVADRAALLWAARRRVAAGDAGV